MLDSIKLLSAKRKYLFVLILLCLTSIICVAFSITGEDDFDIARREVLLRRIGHELLLQSGDSTSRVLPIEKIAENEYRITFENELTFQPEVLVNTTRNLLAKDPLTTDYVVNVLNCGSNSVAYGYAITQNKKNDIIACINRKQPRACYIINIKFKPAHIGITKNMYLLGGLPVLAFLGLFLIKNAKPGRNRSEKDEARIYTIGSVLFNPREKHLTINNQTITLTGTETRLMLILASSPNQIIARSRLQKEIWEDEGVIVGRSLDMFISKLRKKLEPATDVNIVVVRGKGYKLEVSS